MIVTEEMIMDVCESLQIDKQTANNLFKLLRFISQPEPPQLLNNPIIGGTLPCDHNYNQVDTHWNRCTHCGMYAPIGQ